MPSNSDPRPASHLPFSAKAGPSLNYNRCSPNQFFGPLGMTQTGFRVRNRQRQAAAGGKTVNPLDDVTRLSAENHALRAEITLLQGQWEVLKMTLGNLATSTCPQENHG